MRCMEISPSLCGQYNKGQLSLDFEFDLQLFAGEKTEEPTAKRRSDARNKGQVAKSQELNAALVMLAGFFVLKALGSHAVDEVMGYSAFTFGHLVMDINEESIMQLFIGMVILLAKTSIPLMVFIMIIGLGVNLFQVGMHFSTESLSFNPGRLNPIKGIGRIFSKRSLVELIKSILKIIIIGFFIYGFLKDQILAMPQLIYLDLLTSTSQMADIIFDLAFRIIGVFFVMAIADYCYQKWQHTQDLKMSKQEVKEEFKQMEGDPQIKGKIRSKQRQMAMSRMMQEVPKADVIITNPTHFAVAMKYESGMAAPIVIAKGQDYVAQKIKEVARENRVPIVENKPLARALYASVEIGEAIPQSLYKSVAEVLAYVYRLKRKRRRAA